MTLGSTQPLIEMSTRSISWGKGGRCVRLTTLPPSCAVVTKPGHFNFLEPLGPVQACNGADFTGQHNANSVLITQYVHTSTKVIRLQIFATECSMQGTRLISLSKVQWPRNFWLKIIQESNQNTVIFILKLLVKVGFQTAQSRSTERKTGVKPSAKVLIFLHHHVQTTSGAHKSSWILRIGNLL